MGGLSEINSSIEKMSLEDSFSSPSGAGGCGGSQLAPQTKLLQGPMGPQTFLQNNATNR